MKNLKEVPKPPKGLKGKSAKLWNGYAAELHARSLILESDLSALERLCRIEAQCDDLVTQIEKEGATKTDKNGDTRRSAAVMTLNNLTAIAESLKRSLALGAFFRHRIGAPIKEDKPASLLLELMRRPVSSWTPPPAKDETGT